MTEQTLLLWSIGPVQSFIASARKTVDLWSGSFLLSALTQKALDAFTESQKRTGNPVVDIIFPAFEPTRAALTEDQSRIASIPNRVLCMVHGDLEKTQELASRVVALVFQEINRILEMALTLVFPETCDTSMMKKLAQEQFEYTMEMFWVAEPLATTEDLTSVRQTLEQKLHLKKSNRPFRNLLQEGLVCSVCGVHEALHELPYRKQDRISAMKKNVRDTWAKVMHPYEQLFHSGEGLCGICLAKRLGRDVLLANRSHSNERKEFQRLRFLSTEDFSQDNEKASSYFAILLMDGDNMGKWLSGERGDLGELEGIDRLRTISHRLNEYALTQVPAIVNKYQGQVIYAGGDDVLAFAPIGTVFAMAGELRRAFGSAQGLGHSATASAGIVMAHSHTPMNFLLEEARRMEKLAKSYHVALNGSRTEKDALGITIYTRSGESREMVVPWTTDRSGLTEEHPNSVIRTMGRLVHELSRSLSPHFIFQWKRTVQLLVGRNLKTGKIQLDDRALSVELFRLMKRAYEGASTDNLWSLAQALMEIHRCMDNSWMFAQLLEVGAFLHKKEVHIEEGRSIG